MSDVLSHTKAAFAFLVESDIRSRSKAAFSDRFDTPEIQSRRPMLKTS